MRKRIAIVLPILVAFCMVFVGTAYAVTTYAAPEDPDIEITVSADKTSVKPGGTVTFTATIEKNAGFSVLIVSPKLDGQYLTFGEWLTGGNQQLDVVGGKNAVISYKEDDISQGMILENETPLVTAATSGNYTGTGAVLVAFTATVSAEAPEETTLADVGLTYCDGSDTAENKPTVAVTNTSIEVKNSLPGDLDNDGEVTDWDGVLMDRYLAGWTVEIDEAALDFDGDGEVSDWDGVILDRYLAGWNL